MNRRHRGKILTVVCATALGAGCGEPPGDPILADRPAAEARPHPPCPGGTPDVIQAADFTCGPDHTWQLVVEQDWLCPGGQRRTVTRVRRIDVPCEPEGIGRDGIDPRSVRPDHAGQLARQPDGSHYPADAAGGILR